jgi:hypothetical protein
MPHPPAIELVALHKLALRFADQPEYQVNLAPGGVHERMLELMELYPDHAFVQSAGTYLIGMLAEFIPNRVFLVGHNSHSAIERVLVLMERKPMELHFQQSGVTALRNLSDYMGSHLSRAARAVCVAMA